jgi:tetratricopeptide (TPR) repeat protein
MKLIYTILVLLAVMMSTECRQTPEALIQKADDFTSQGDYGNAIRAYDEAIQQYPNYAKAWVEKGRVLYFQDKYDEAIKAFDVGIRLDPKNYDAWNYKGIVLYHQGKYDEAVKAYDKAIEIYESTIIVNDPNDPELATFWSNKGGALAWLGQYEEAIKCFETANWLDPENNKVPSLDDLKAEYSKEAA